MSTKTLEYISKTVRSEKPPASTGRGGRFFSPGDGSARCLLLACWPTSYFMRRALAIAVALCLSACAKRGEHTEPTASSASASAASLPAPVNPRAETIPTEQDFEEQAVREISPANLDAELERLRQEIQP